MQRKFGRIIAICTACFMLCAAAPMHAGAQEGMRVPVIMYHSITDKAQNPWIIPQYALEADLKYLAENGYTAVFISELTDFVHGRASLPEKPVVLTFDDGMYNNLTLAMPLMEQYNMKMMLSVIGEPAQIFTDTEDLSERYGHLSWAQLRQMLDTGRVELANHTWALHSNERGRRGCCRKNGECLEEYRQMLTADLMRLQDALYQHCGVRPTTFTYPYGSKCPELLEILRELGFEATLSCGEGVNLLRRGDVDGLFDIKRFNRDSGRSVEDILGKHLLL